MEALARKVPDDADIQDMCMHCENVRSTSNKTNICIGIIKTKTY